MLDFLRSHHLSRAWAIGPLNPPIPAPYPFEDDRSVMAAWISARARLTRKQVAATRPTARQLRQNRRQLLAQSRP